MVQVVPAEQSGVGFVATTAEAGIDESMDPRIRMVKERPIIRFMIAVYGVRQARPRKLLLGLLFM